MDIRRLGLNMYTLGTLYWHDILTTDQLIKLTELDLLTLSSIGKKTVTEIVDVLQLHQLKLKAPIKLPPKKTKEKLKRKFLIAKLLLRGESYLSLAIMFDVSTTTIRTSANRIYSWAGRSHINWDDMDKTPDAFKSWHISHIQKHHEIWLTTIKELEVELKAQGFIYD